MDKITKTMGQGMRAREFEQIDRKSISKYSDKELALWQSQYPVGSPQAILAEHEWQRRLTVEQIRGARFAAYIGILGTIIGALTTWLITKW